jgi:hypothetical protein
VKAVISERIEQEHLAIEPIAINEQCAELSGQSQAVRHQLIFNRDKNMWNDSAGQRCIQDTDGHGTTDWL